MGSLVSRLNSTGGTPPNKTPDNNKSDITGTDKQQQQAGGGDSKGGGGGGSPGGGGGSPSGSGSSPANVPFTPMSPTPVGTNPAAEGKKEALPTGRGTGDTGASVLAKKEDPNLDFHSTAGFGSGSGGLSSSLLASSGTGSTGSSSPGSNPSHSGASGGGSGGGAGGGGIGDKHCSGKDCQALAVATTQFNPVGSLGGGGGGGGGLGGLDSLDTGSSLDNLFKADSSKALPETPSLAGLDGGATPFDAPVGADAQQAAQAGSAEIGSSNVDLFDRVRHFHERAQKRGLVVGMTRKL